MIVKICNCLAKGSARGGPAQKGKDLKCVPGYRRTHSISDSLRMHINTYEIESFQIPSVCSRMQSLAAFTRSNVLVTDVNRLSEFVVNSSTAAMASEPAKCDTNSLVSLHLELLAGA